MPTFRSTALRPILLVTTITTIATVGLTLAPAADAATGSTVSYVALGDSYSAGVGTTDSAGSCGQSPEAYGALYAAATAPASFTFAACSGATAATTESGQLSGLSAQTSLVSLTDGGNDIGFVSVAQTCLLDGQSACLAAESAAATTAETTLPGELDALYSAIQTDAPHARVVVLGYPEFYDTAAPLCIDWLTPADHAAANQLVLTLDQVIQTEAAKYPGFVYESVDALFAGHRICDSTPWINNPGLESGWYHPTNAGQAEAYLPALAAGANAG
ncbi:SGNH/GDSL hydrolase family protein [Actinospica durhamensis]|uniref:SGNH/GDSL hydrolase family protein n=1 Tax=Actinospica durhamensis TaxID=1508375 RepID=A0A941IS83_9ACTN|nr:SGNH/GDSL hydrolase family protein [Actinospica durhamensis]MBR7839655.1 SGNH/GDSL hydrolase family protein [Actinospica durhamensis]